MKLQDFDVVNGFLGCLEVEGCLSPFANPGLKVIMTLIAKFCHSMNRQSQGIIEGDQSKLSAYDIAEFFGVPKEGAVTYFENKTSDVLFQKYVSTPE